MLGRKLPTHEKGKYQSLDIVKSQAEITTISKASDLIRTLFFNEVTNEDDRKSVERHLSVLLDRLCRMGLRSIPRSLDIASLHEWSQVQAPFDLENLRRYMEKRKNTLEAQAHQVSQELFLDPKKRGLWFERNFESQRVLCPDYAIESKTGRKTSDENEVKQIYLQEGACFLRNMQHIRPPFDEAKEEKCSAVPDISDSRVETNPHPKPNHRPRWWNKMYHRGAKGVNEKVWNGLMKEANWRDVLQVILSNGHGKSSGYDGVTCDLVCLLSEDSSDKPTPFLEILTFLINTSIRLGITLPSWRKAIISMIPKRKEDGSLTNLVSEMRPISVLQEFGKISAKLLSNRLGDIFLTYPNILNSAQKAFLRDGCTSQCINTLLNILEDFKGKKKKGGTLFLLAYDLVKAYDSVQPFTIRASLERFNMPELFISYVLSTLKMLQVVSRLFLDPQTISQLRPRCAKETRFLRLSSSASWMPYTKACILILSTSVNSGINSPTTTISASRQWATQMILSHVANPGKTSGRCTSGIESQMARSERCCA